MIESLKKMEILDALKNHGGNGADNYRNLISQLFLDFPNLNQIEVSKTNEYNDNDYSDYFRILSINGLRIEDDYYYEEDENGEYVKNSGDENDESDESEKTKVDPKLIFSSTEIAHICNVLHTTEDYFENNSEDDSQFLSREEYVFGNGNKKQISISNKGFDAYYSAVTNKALVKTISVFKNFPNWALYYCIDLKEKLPIQDVENIFKKDIKYSYFYAVHVLKNRLPEKIEKYFNLVEKKIKLKSFENKTEHYYDRRKDNQDKFYIEKYKEFVKNL